MPSFDRHVFVCTNARAADPPRGSCKRRGGEEVRDALKKHLSACGVDGTQVRANIAGCLDQCERGVVVVVYPEQAWYGGVTVADVPELVERHLLGGQLVERLLLADQPLTLTATPRPRLPVITARPGGSRPAAPNKPTT